jgi:thiosulfate/3-mercaptopyruvate sulfurtransferase
VTDPGPLVDAAWLAAHLDDVALADVRWYLDGRSGYEAFLAGHLPGAVWVDLDADLAGPTGPETGRHPLPTPEAFAAALAAKGLAAGRPVVAYDDAGGSIAARLWWMLRVLGQPAAVLDGGLAAWPGPLAAGPAAVTPVTRAAVPWPAGAFVDTPGVDAVRRDRARVLLDARAGVRYDGTETQVDPRPGHIPGAKSAPWAGNLGPSGRFLDASRLRARFEALGVEDGTEVVVSCGSGVTACHDLLALDLAGYHHLALYPGSWSAWSSDPDRPAAVGPEPG